MTTKVFVVGKGFNMHPRNFPDTLKKHFEKRKPEPGPTQKARPATFSSDRKAFRLTATIRMFVRSRLQIRCTIKCYPCFLSVFIT